MRNTQQIAKAPGSRVARSTATKPIPGRRREEFTKGENGREEAGKPLMYVQIHVHVKRNVVGGSHTRSHRPLLTTTTAGGCACRYGGGHSQQHQSQNVKMGLVAGQCQ